MGKEFERGHGGVRRYRLPQLADPCVFDDRDNKVVGFVLSGSKEEAVYYYFCVQGFGLVLNQIRGIVRDSLIVDGWLGWIGELGAIAQLVIVLV